MSPPLPRRLVAFALPLLLLPAPFDVFPDGGLRRADQAPEGLGVLVGVGLERCDGSAHAVKELEQGLAGVPVVEAAVLVGAGGLGDELVVDLGAHHGGDDDAHRHDVADDGRPGFYVFKGRMCVITAEVGRYLGYAEEGKKLADCVRDKWNGEASEGHHYAVLTGEDLREFKANAGDTLPRWVSSTARLMVLFEAGVDLVCLKTEKPQGVELRQALVDKVLPRLRRGQAVQPGADIPVFAPAPTPPALSGPAPLDLATLTQTIVAAVVAGVREAMSDRVESLHQRFDAVETRLRELGQRRGLISAEQASQLKEDITECAKWWVQLGWSKKPGSLRSAGLEILGDLYGVVNWGNGTPSIARVPETDYGRVLGRLARLRWEAREQLRRAPRKPGKVIPIKPI